MKFGQHQLDSWPPTKPLQLRNLLEAVKELKPIFDELAKTIENISEAAGVPTGHSPSGL
jgi:hypothetical protein